MLIDGGKCKKETVTGKNETVLGKFLKKILSSFLLKFIFDKNGVNDNSEYNLLRFFFVNSFQ